MIEHCTDYRRVKRLADANPISEDKPWKLAIWRDVKYLIETDDDTGEDLGVWCFEPDDEKENGFLMHAAMGPKCRGKRAVSSALDAISWLFDNTDACGIIAPINVKTRGACVIAISTGLKPMGEHGDMRRYYIDRSLYADVRKGYRDG